MTFYSSVSNDLKHIFYNLSEVIIITNINIYTNYK